MIIYAIKQYNNIHYSVTRVGNNWQIRFIPFTSDSTCTLSPYPWLSEKATSTAPWPSTPWPRLIQVPDLTTDLGLCTQRHLVYTYFDSLIETTVYVHTHIRSDQSKSEFKTASPMATLLDTRYESPTGCTKWFNHMAMAEHRRCLINWPTDYSELPNQALLSKCSAAYWQLADSTTALHFVGICM